MRYISEFVEHEVFQGAGKDAHGNTIDQWADAVTIGIYAFDPGSSNETTTSSANGNEARVITSPRVLAPSTAVIGARDRLIVRGKTFEVEGDPLDFRNPYDSTMNGLSVSLKAVDG